MEVYDELFDRIYSFAEENKNFDTSFVDSVKDQYDRKGSMTPKQIEALENIIDRFRIP